MLRFYKGETHTLAGCLKDQHAALITALDFFSIDPACWPAALQVVHATAQQLAEAAKQERTQLQQLEQYVADTAAWLFAEIKAGMLAVPLEHKYKAWYLKPLQPDSISASFGLYLDSAQPPRYHLAALRGDAVSKTWRRQPCIRHLERDRPLSSWEHDAVRDAKHSVLQTLEQLCAAQLMRTAAADIRCCRSQEAAPRPSDHQHSQ